LERYHANFGLSAKSTALDFRAASTAARMHWLSKMCDDGECLHRVDWYCGFSIRRADSDSESEAKVFVENVESCFLTLAKAAAATETLGKLRLICGRKHMVFAPERDVTPAQCAKEGGKWGQKIKLFADEDQYLNY
jgi:hypothetical protein